MVAIVVLAAGQGKRMLSKLPKVLHPLAGRPMVQYAFELAKNLQASQIVAVVSPTIDKLDISDNFDITKAVQKKALGSGHAMRLGIEALKKIDQDVLVVFADTPLLRSETLQSVFDKKQTLEDNCLIVVGMRPQVPGQYGRIIHDQAGKIIKIVEYADATESELASNLCNSGVIYGNGKLLHNLLCQLTPNNAKGEYYATDCVQLARNEGISSYFVEACEEDFRGINDRYQLATAEAIIQTRLRKQHMLNGVTLQDPNSVRFAYDTQIATDVTIGANVIFGCGVKVESGANILPFCHIEDTHLQTGAVVGPFARLRGKAVLQEKAEVGNFVEVKNTNIGQGSKVKHLSYLGDSLLGREVNIGAGTITCNYDGRTKSKTILQDNVFVGSSSTLIAPVTVGGGAYIAAGSVVTSDVPGDSLAVARSRQTIKQNWVNPSKKSDDNQSDIS